MIIDNTVMEDFKLRPMKCECNFLSKSDGSAILSQGSTVALVSVNGPLDIKMQSQSIEKATLEVLFNSKGGKPAVGDRYKEHIIRQTCETAILGSLYPRTGITVTIQELEDNGGFLACAINSCCLALLNAGLSLRHTFAAVWCCVDVKGEILVEPAPSAVAEARAHLTFVFDTTNYSFVTGFTEGKFSECTYKEAMERCRAASHLIADFYRDIVKKYSHVIG